MAPADVVVIGGGIAGLAAAWHLAGRGVRPVLLERELLLASHASGRNAAIFRQVDADLAGAQLAARSRELLPRLGADAELLSPTGGLYCGDGPGLAALSALATRAGIGFERLDRAGLADLVPALAGGGAAAGLFFAGDGVLDVHALTGALARGAGAKGATLRIGSGVQRIQVKDGRITGVLLESGERIATERVLLAAGAWTAELGGASGVPLPIVPRRRHLAMLVSGRTGALEVGRSVAGVAGPVVWRVDEEVYFRPEPGGILASPCDEEEWPPGVPPTAPEALAQLALRLPRLAPGLAELSVRSAWACLRSFAPDGGLVAGADPRLSGLTVIAGLGGRGMTCGLGLGEVAAAAVLGEAHPLAEVLSPARFFAAQG